MNANSNQVSRWMQQFRASVDYKPPGDIFKPKEPNKPRVTVKYSACDFLQEFVETCGVNINQQVLHPKYHLEQKEKEEKEFSVDKTGEELVKLSKSERKQYFKKLAKYKAEKYQMHVPWLDFKSNRFVKYAGAEYVGYAVLHFTCHSGDYDLTKLFVKLRGDPNIQSEQGLTPLMLHCKLRNGTKIVSELVRDGTCDVNVVDRYEMSAMTYTVNYSGRHLEDKTRAFRETFQIERILLKNGADINHVDIYNRTPVHYAFVPIGDIQCHGNRDPIALVSDICAVSTNSLPVQVDVADVWGRTPIHYAAMLGAQISSNWLTSSAASVHSTDYHGNQPFQHAVLNEHISLAVDYINQSVNVKHNLYRYHQYNRDYFVKSSFRHVLELGWMGVAYLMVNRGVEITSAVCDALETENFQLAKTLIYKTLKHLNNVNQDNCNLHHIISKYIPQNMPARKAFEDPWSVRIVEILDENYIKWRLNDKYGRTPLHYACLNRHCNLASHYLGLDGGSDTDKEYRDGVNKETPLHMALYNKDEVMSKMLISEYNVNVNSRLQGTKKDGNRVPLHIAASIFNLPLCKVLLNAGASTRHTYSQPERYLYRKQHSGDYTVLHTSVRLGLYDLTKLFLRHRAKVDELLYLDDFRGYQTCLHLACANNNFKMIQLLCFNYKANIRILLKYAPIPEINPNATNMKKEESRWKKDFEKAHNVDCIDASALHIACRRKSNFDVTRLLLERKADANLLYREAILIARKNNKLLRERHPHRVDLPDLCLLHTHVRLSSFGMVELLLKHNADCNIRMSREIVSQNGDIVALHTAVRSGSAQIVRTLLEHRAKPNEEMIKQKCRDSDFTALHLAVRSSNSTIVELLLRFGANAKQRMISTNSQFGEHYALHMSVHNTDYDNTRRLLLHDSNPDCPLYLPRTIHGDVTALHMAVRQSNYKLVELLLLFGADPDVKLKPKNVKEVIWKWKDVSGIFKEYSKNVNKKLEVAHQLYRKCVENKRIYIENFEKLRAKSISKHTMKMDETMLKRLDMQIKNHSIFSLNTGSYFSKNKGYCLNFESMQQIRDSGSKKANRVRKMRQALRYTHPFDAHHDGGSCLWMAVRNRDLNMCSLLVDYHCDMNISNVRGEIPIVHAVKRNDLLLAAILMRNPIAYDDRYRQRVIRGVRRRKKLQYRKPIMQDIDDEFVSALSGIDTRFTNIIGEKRMPFFSNNNNNNNSNSNTNTSSSVTSGVGNKRRKLSKNKKQNTIFNVSENIIDGCDDEQCPILFVGTDVCQADSTNGWSALHHCVMTDGLWNPSFEEEAMMLLLVRGETLRAKTLLEAKVHDIIPYRNELNEEERKNVEIADFPSEPRMVDVNVEDSAGRSALFYALLQKSGIMKHCLLTLNARSNVTMERTAVKMIEERDQAALGDKTASLRKLYSDLLLHEPYNSVLDARRWRTEFFIEDEELSDLKTNELMNIERAEVDAVAKRDRDVGNKATVLQEGNEVFDVDMLYVNVEKGKYGAYMFYKLQLIYIAARQLTILWCRWGRPGEEGNFQRSPYQNKADAIKEFKKIFQSKTLNEWDNRSRSKFEPKRWRIQRKKRRRNKKKSKENPNQLVNSLKEILRTVPKEARIVSLLPEYISEFAEIVFNVAALRQSRRELGLTANEKNFGMLEDEDLDNSYALIKKLSVLIREKDEENAISRKFHSEKNKEERKLRDRQTERDRNKNTFLRDEQRMTVNQTRISSAIRANKARITTLERQIALLEKQSKVVLADDSQQKLQLIQFAAELKVNEETKASFALSLSEAKVNEANRIVEECKVHEPLDAEGKEKISNIAHEIQLLSDKAEIRKKKIGHLSNQYYLMMPLSEFKNTYITAIDTRGKVNKYFRIMMGLAEHQIAISALMGAQFRAKTIDPIDYCYLSLGCEILPLYTKSRRYKLLLEYANRTASPKISEKKCNIYKVWRRGEEERFRDYRDLKNRMILWHGSDAANIAGILTKGLKIAPPEADATGYMFGKGVYFADAFQKSRNYSGTGNRRNVANLRCLFLCEVAIGEMYECIQAEYMEGAKSGFNSTKGLGERGPDPRFILTTVDGAMIPNSPTISYPERTTTDKEGNIVKVAYYLNWNEYIVYDEAQVKLKYIFMLSD